MAHINFLETPRFSLGQFQFKELELNYFWMMVASGVVVLFMLTYGIVQRMRVGSLNEELELALAEAKRVGGASATTTTSQKASLMDGIFNRVTWSPILNAITNATPDTISLNYIKGVTLGRSMQIEGVGADVLAATRYQEALSHVPFFSKILLLSSSEKAPGTVKGEAAPAAKAGTKPEATGGMPSAGKRQLVFEIQGWLK